MSTASVPVIESPAPAELLQVVLDVSLTGIILFRPVYASDAESEIIDLAYVRLNPAAQRMLQLPEYPAETFLTLYPNARSAGIFAFYRDTFLSGIAGRYDVNYQHDGLDNFFQLAAHPSGGLLVVSFTDTADQDRTAVELALRESQVREQAALAEAKAQREQLQSLFMQAPANIASLSGPQHIFTLANAGYSQLFGNRQLVGQPIRTALPELEGQPFFGLLDEVYRTGETFYGNEVVAYLDQSNSGSLIPVYFNFIYQAVRDASGEVSGILILAHDVSEQVLARQKVQNLNEELAATNEELQTANEEFLSGNAELNKVHLQLKRLNQLLEVRVWERTQALELALRETEGQRQKLEEQQNLLRQILRQVPASVATLTGPEHRYNFFNANYQALSEGRTQSGLTVAEVFPEVVEQGFIKLLDEVYRTGEPFIGVETPIELYNAATNRPEQRFVDFVYQPLTDGQGLIQGILAFILDVTDKVHTRQRVEQSERQLHLLTDALPVLIGYLDHEQKYQFANQAYIPWFNQDPAELLGRPVREVIGEQAYANVQGYIDRALAGERLDFEAQMPYREDFIKYIRTSYVPDIQDGKVVGFYTLVVDVTEQVEARKAVEASGQQALALAEELGLSNERLTRTNADLDTFVYTASHDLKAPITNVEGLLHALLEELPVAFRSSEVAYILDLMQGAVDRFKTTIEQLTDVARLQQEQDQPLAPIRLADVIHDVRLDLTPLLSETGAELEVSVKGAPTISFSAKNLRSVVYNLLSNALKYRHPERVPQVRIRCRTEENHLVLTVQDNGLGLTEANTAKLFGMFQRFHTHVEGSGVGLYMVRKMVENIGGHIIVESVEGSGTTFSVYFPR